jgi:DNA-binding XRE family transcriptional regulator
MKSTSTRYKSAKTFGKAIGLKEVDMELVRQKVKLIERLKAERIERGLSQAALGKLVGTLQPAIARMESGIVSHVSMDFLLKIALAMNVSVTISKEAA